MSISTRKGGEIHNEITKRRADRQASGHHRVPRKEHRPVMELHRIWIVLNPEPETVLLVEPSYGTLT